MERDEQLIETLRDYPCLYNSKSADFKLLLKKENAWTAVTARLQRTGELVSRSQTVTFAVTVWITAVEHFVLGSPGSRVGDKCERFNGSCPDCYCERNSLASRDYW